MEKCKWSGDQRDEDVILSFEKDRYHGFSWPQRNYKCRFCNREFKCAQALGGHMNVHRRDRARIMRISSSLSPMDSPRSNPNHNTSFSPSPCEAKLSASSSNEKLELRSNPKEYEFCFDNVAIAKCSQPHDHMELRGGESGNKDNVAMIDVGRTNGAKDNQDLDLELRLGY